MTFVIVKNKSAIIGKEVYSGDTSELSKILSERQIKDPNITFEIYDESQKDVFEAIQLGDGQEKPDYKSLKSADEKVDFIAAKLGLI